MLKEIQIDIESHSPLHFGVLQTSVLILFFSGAETCQLMASTTIWVIFNPELRPECPSYQTAPLPLKSAASFCVFHVNKWYHLSSNPSQKLGTSLCLSSALSSFCGVSSWSVKWFWGVDGWSVFSRLPSVRWGHVTASWSEHRWCEQSQVKPMDTFHTISAN